MSAVGFCINTLTPDRHGEITVLSAKDALWRFRGKTNFAKAIEMVSLGKAEIVTPYIVRKAYCKRKLRLETIQRDNHTCHYCGRRGNTIDHVVPLSKGGKWALENLVCACKECNLAKGSTDYHEYIRSIAEVS